MTQNKSSKAVIQSRHCLHQKNALSPSEECIVSIADEADYEVAYSVKIYTSQIALLPACAFHYSKGKETAGTIPSTPYDANFSASGSTDCTQAKLVGEPQPSPPTRFPRETPMDDLKTWLFFPPAVGRTGFLLTHPKFGIKDFHAILRVALREIIALHVEIDALVAYGARYPYCLSRKNPAPKANNDYYDMRPHDFVRLPRNGLEEAVLEAGREVDYLRSVVEELKAGILGARRRVAKVMG